MVMDAEQNCFLRLAAAFVRGRLIASDGALAGQPLFATPLDTLTADEMRELMRVGTEAGLRLHKFKRTMELPRVQRVMGILRGFQPAGLLDIGSGRGAFLWPLLDGFPWLPVTAVDILDRRVEDILAVRRGGIAQVTAVRADANRLPFPDRHFDVVTMLEVLEHIPDAAAALSEVARIAQRAIILSVPSTPDDNPEHIHVFDARTLTSMLRAAGMNRVIVSEVRNHLIVVATREL